MSLGSVTKQFKKSSLTSFRDAFSITFMALDLEDLFQSGQTEEWNIKHAPSLVRAPFKGILRLALGKHVSNISRKVAARVQQCPFPNSEVCHVPTSHQVHLSFHHSPGPQ